MTVDHKKQFEKLESKRTQMSLEQHENLLTHIFSIGDTPLVITNPVSKYVVHIRYIFKEAGSRSDMPGFLKKTVYEASFYRPDYYKLKQLWDAYSLPVWSITGL